MLTGYIDAAMHKARYEILSDDGTFYSEIPGFNGTYANTDTLERCREAFQEALEEWILVYHCLPGYSSRQVLTEQPGKNCNQEHVIICSQSLAPHTPMHSKTLLSERALRALLHASKYQWCM